MSVGHAILFKCVMLLILMYLIRLLPSKEQVEDTSEQVQSSLVKQDMSSFDPNTDNEEEEEEEES